MSKIYFVLLASVQQMLAGDARETVMGRELPKLQHEYHATEVAPLGPETPLSRIYYQRLNHYARYARKEMHDWPAEPGAEYHKLDGSQEPAVRQDTDVALAFAVLATCGEFDEKKAGVSLSQVRADAAALIRYLAVTHHANFLPAGDGKSWGDHWQSALWTARVGDAAWLLWKDLPDDTKVMAARMIIHEADRFNTRPPDNGEVGDTKSEENAWNSEVIALAACMFQQHPNARLWRERAGVYMFNSYSTAADHEDDRVLDGQRLRDWVTTTNIHLDFTLENHDRVHPDYLSCFTLMLQNAALYRLAKMEPPAAMFHHVRDCNEVLMHLTATNGTLFYINGQDWWPHRHEMALIAGGLSGVLFSNADAAGLERAALDSLGRMHARFDDGRAYNAREGSIPNVEEELMAAYARNCLAHRLFGDHAAPGSLREIQERQSGTRIFESGGFVTHRTARKFVSFCWVNEMMGLVYPADDTWFTAPQERGLVGSIEAQDAKDTPPALEKHTVRKLQLSGHSANDGFAFVGKLARCEGKIEQRIAVISLPGDPVLYVEQLRARQTVEVKEVATGTVSILNEDAPPLASNRRRIWTARGEEYLLGATNAPPDKHVWETPWANLEDKLGIATQASGRMQYVANHRYRRSRLTQTLAANYRQNFGLQQPGGIISEAVVELVPNARHSDRHDLLVERPEKNAFAITEGDWKVIVNLNETPIEISISGRTIHLAGFGVEVRRMESRL